MIQENNGLLVESGDEAALVAAMERAYLERESWNSQEIAAEAAAKYNADAVAAAIGKSYSNLINPCVE